MLCSAIIVNWNSAELLLPCIKSLKASGKHQIIVVDNNSSDNSVAAVRKIKGVELIANKNNGGFGRACNQGAKKAKGKYLLFLNPDVVVGKDSIGHLSDFLDENKDAAVVGPQCLSTQGKAQNGYYLRFPSLLQVLFFYTKLKNYFSAPWLKELLYEQSLSEKASSVDQVPGAALMIRKSVFDDLAGFREDYFLWFEDVDLCWRVKQLGKQIYYLPQAKVRHQGGGSFMKWTDVTEKKKRFYKSLKLYFHYNKGEIENVLLSIIPEKFFI